MNEIKQEYLPTFDFDMTNSNSNANTNSNLVGANSYLIRIFLKGSWLSHTVSSVERAFTQLCQNLSETHPNQDTQTKKCSVTLILSEDLKVDTTGAWFIAQAVQSINATIIHPETSENPPAYELISPYLNYSISYPLDPETLPLRRQFLEAVGVKAVDIWRTTHSMLAFFGEALITWFHLFYDPNAQTKSRERFRWISVYYHIHEVGIRAIPIIGLISFLIGIVLAYQGITQLRKFGGEIFSIDLMGISILREIAVLITAIVIAGRSGSAYTAQIGIMALNQEIDAIKMMGLNPMLILVWPRLLALIIVMPMLVFLSMMAGLFGGMVISMLSMDISYGQFIRQLQKAIEPQTFWVGMSKAPLFATIIGMVGCFRGFQVSGGAESVGRMTTQSVVESIFLVIVFDGFMSVLFSYLGI